MDDDWKQASIIEQQIQLPKIPEQQFSIVDFGAKTSPADASEAINNAIKAANKAGGGKVIIPQGEWLSKGPVNLLSKVNLHVSEGARLLFSTQAKHYLPVVKTRWEGTEVFTYSPKIYGNNVTDVAITGKGIIDGNKDSEFIPWYKKQNEDVYKIRKMGFDLVPVSQRQFGEGHYLRPPLIQIFHGKRVLLEDYTAKNSAFWVNHLVYTQHATVRGIKVDSHNPNNDGLDIESSSFVLVENNFFRTGDDAVVVKSGRDADGREIGIPSTDILVRNNDMGGEDGIGLGSEMSGGIKRVFFTDNVMHSGSAAFRLKSNLDRGGLVEMIRIRNAKVESFDTLFWFQLNYPSQLGGNFPATYQDIVFENITAKNIGLVWDMHAPASSPLKNVLFKNVSIQQAQRLFDVENAENIQFESVTIGAPEGSGRDPQILSGTLNWKAIKE